MTTSNVNVDQDAPSEQPVVPSGLRRLHAVDGLFLRDVHLKQMQDYSRDLALLAAVAGPGVRYGYGLTLNRGNKTVHVGPGLAVDAAGTPLRSRNAVKMSFAKIGADVSGDAMWLIEVVVGKPQYSGDEETYGTLCADPCGGARIQPWEDATVILSFNQVPVALPNENNESISRNKFASLYFERERAQIPWLRPVNKQTVLKSILTRRWDTGEPEEEGHPGRVPLGALLRIDGVWVLDPWIARRDVDESPSRVVWESHLGLRPWNVFIAQVLQFQDQLADENALRQAAAADTAHELTEKWSELEKQIPSKAAKYAQELRNFTEELVASVTSGELGHALSDRYEELPPAGLLPVANQNALTDENVVEYFETLFGDEVDVSVVKTRPDCALRHLTQAQHLDRIPLSGGTVKPHVRIYLPQLSDDLPVLNRHSYPWVVFTRWCEEQVIPLRDCVNVYVANEGMLECDKNGKPELGGLPGETPCVTLQYEADQWRHPSGEVPLKKLQELKELVETQLEGKEYWFVAIGIAAQRERQTLAWLRAKLLCVNLGLDGVEPEHLTFAEAGPVVKGVTGDAIVLCPFPLAQRLRAQLTGPDA